MLATLSHALRPQGWPSFEVAGDVVDVRIAQFLLSPGSSLVTDSPEVEAILAQASPFFHTAGRNPSDDGGRSFRTPSDVQKRKLKAPLGMMGLLLDAYKARDEVVTRFSEAQLAASGWACGVRAAAVAAIFERQRPLLEAGCLMAPLLTTEMPLVRVLAAMERPGLCLDTGVYETARRPLLRRLEEVRMPSAN